MRRAPGPKAVGTFLEIRFKDRLQNQQRCRLDDPVADRRNAQRSQLPVGLGDIHPLDRLGAISLLAQFGLDFIEKPFRPAFRLDHPF
jgi:hypothetical protein